MKSYCVSHLSDRELLTEASRLAASARRLAAELVVHVAEIECRQLYLGRGFPSMHAYCTEVLGLTDAEAYNRIEAARAGQRYPRVFEMLLEGSLSLTTVQLVARRLTEDNHAALLAEAADKTKSQVQHLLARWFPQPDVPASTRKLPMPRGPVMPAAPGEPPLGAPVAQVGVSTGVSVGGASAPAAPSAPPGTPSTPPPPPRAMVAPLSPDRYKMTFTADTETLELLEAAKDLLSHVVGGGDTAEVMKRALKSLVSELARKKFGLTDRPRASRGPKDDADISASVKRAVWIRDRGCCAFVSADGRRCGSRRLVQFHHHGRERCEGGRGTVDNIQLRCAAHNRYESAFADGFPKRAPAHWATRSGTSARPHMEPRPSGSAKQHELGPQAGVTVPPLSP